MRDERMKVYVGRVEALRNGFSRWTYNKYSVKITKRGGLFVQDRKFDDRYHREKNYSIRN